MKIDEILREFWIARPPERKDGEYTIVDFDAMFDQAKQEITNLIREAMPEMIPDRAERERWYRMFPEARLHVADIRNQVIYDIEQALKERGIEV